MGRGNKLKTKQISKLKDVRAKIFYSIDFFETFTVDRYICYLPAGRSV